jgi:ligand-binding SRPBCC domain-containing protein
MTTFRRSIDIQAPVEAVFAFHMDPANLARVAPPGSQTEVLSSTDVPLRRGSHVVIRTAPMGVSVTVEAEIVAIEENRMFEDRQVRGPFRSWRHRHLFDPIPGGTRLTDEVEVEPPGGLPGRLLAQGLILRQLDAAFAYRQEETRRLLEAAAPSDKVTG